MKKKNRQKGFTLVELMISIAILSVVGLAIFSFMATSSRIYGREVTQADLQYESQLVINQLQDMLIDASQSVTYKVTVGGTETEVVNDAGIDESAVTRKEVCIYNGDEYFKVTWEKNEERLYYSHYTGTGGSGGGGTVRTPGTGTALGAGAVPGAGSWTVDSGADHVRMADYVREFSADITNLEKDRSVMFRFLFAVGDVSYATSHNITLRNKVVKGEGESGTVTVVTPAQDRITVSPHSIRVWPGDHVVFTHTISSDNGGYPSQEAVWSLNSVDVKGPPVLDTSLSANGELSVSMDEKCSDMTVTAAVRDGVEKTDGTIYKDQDAATVEVKQVTGLGVALTEGGTYTAAKDQRLIAGSTLQFAVNSMAGYHLSFPQDLTATGVTVTWEMAQGAPYAAVDESGLLSVSDIAPIDTVLQVKAVFNRAGREWASGLSSEYKVVELKGRGLIFVDPGKGEYIAPDGEIWYPEEQRISIDWDKLDPGWKDNGGKGDILKFGYRFQWKVTVKTGGKWGDRYDLKELTPQTGYDFRTKNSRVVIPLKAWMQWNTGSNNSIQAIRIELEICNDSTGQILFTSDPLELDIPRIKFLYSYKEGNTWKDYKNELPLYVTKEAGEVCVYFYKYGDASPVIRNWEKFDNPDNGWYRLTNKGNFKRKYGGWKELDTDRRERTIYFTPNASSGSSIIVHHTWQGSGEYEDTQVVVYFKKPNVEEEGYYVPYPGRDEAYTDSGYLFGDCSFVITTEELPGARMYYKLVIIDDRGKNTKTVTAYGKMGGTKWQKDIPLAE